MRYKTPQKMITNFRVWKVNPRIILVFSGVISMSFIAVRIFVNNEDLTLPYLRDNGRMQHRRHQKHMLEHLYNVRGSHHHPLEHDENYLLKQPQQQQQIIHKLQQLKTTTASTIMITAQPATQSEATGTAPTITATSGALMTATAPTITTKTPTMTTTAPPITATTVPTITATTAPTITATATSGTTLTTTSGTTITTTTGTVTKQQKQKQHQQHDKKKNVIFIIGPGRTGTSLLGEFFNSQEDVFYFFEPLRPVSDYYNNKYTPTERQQSGIINAYLRDSIELLKDIVNCKYRPLNSKFIRRFQIQPSKVLHQLPRNTESILTIRCNKILQKECFKRITFHRLNDLCRKRKYRIVIKELTTRLPYYRISSLAYLPMPTNHEIRVIHAMRDPRAFLYSKYHLKWFGQPGQEQKNPMLGFSAYVNTTCGLIENNLLDFHKRPKEKASMRATNAIKYKLLRYEEYQAANITSLANSLEKFIGPQRISIGKYIRMRTRGPNKIRQVYSVLPRDIKRIAEKWRKYMKPEHIQIIQKTCKNVMKQLGYKDIMVDLGTQTITT